MYQARNQLSQQGGGGSFSANILPSKKLLITSMLKRHNNMRQHMIELQQY